MKVASGFYVNGRIVDDAAMHTHLESALVMTDRERGAKQQLKIGTINN